MFQLLKFEALLKTTHLLKTLKRFQRSVTSWCWWLKVGHDLLTECRCRWRLSHICARLGQGVSVILVSTVSLASQSYHCKLWFKRLTHISLSSTPRVSLISVSFGLFWRINYGWFQTWFLSKEIRKNCFSGPFFQKKMFQKFWFSDFLGIKSQINE